MNNDIPLKYYDIADEYAIGATKPVSDTKHDTLVHYFRQLVTRLMNSEEISEGTQQEIATVVGIDARCIGDIAEFLNRWGNEQPKTWPVFYTARKLSRYTLQMIDLIRRKQQ